MKDHLGKFFGVIAVIAIAGSIIYANYAAKEANEGIAFTDHVRGNPEASVTLVEYSDFQCPACGQFESHVSEILSTYGDQIRFEYRHFPLITIHQQAVPAAQAAEAAGQQGKFWEMHDKLFENQQIWSRASNPYTYFVTYAEEIGLDMDTFKRHYKSSLIKDRIDESFRSARELGLSGTPSFYLNDERMEIESFEDFYAQIEAAVVSDEVEESLEAETDQTEKADITAE